VKFRARDMGGSYGFVWSYLCRFMITSLRRFMETQHLFRPRSITECGRVSKPSCLAPVQRADGAAPRRAAYDNFIARKMEAASGLLVSSTKHK
jgi:hypothetical protein